MACVKNLPLTAFITIRERNKVLARKTRVKKKAEMETLRQRVTDLEQENRRLKCIVSQKLPLMIRSKLLEGGDNASDGPPHHSITSLMSKHGNTLLNVADRLMKTDRCFCITNPLIQGNPIVHVSPAFIELTGYSLEEIVGKNCNFLQGEGTNKDDVR